MASFLAARRQSAPLATETGVTVQCCDAAVQRTPGERDHVVFTLAVAFRHFHWTVPARYSELVRLHRAFGARVRAAGLDVHAPGSTWSLHEVGAIRVRTPHPPQR